MECVSCNDTYDLLCANISEKQSLRVEAWICDPCKVKKPRNDNTNTPVRGTKSSNRTDDASYEQAQGPTSKDSDSCLSQLQQDKPGGVSITALDESWIAAIKEQIIGAVKMELPSVLSSVIKIELQPVKNDMQIVKDLQRTVVSISKKQEDMQKTMNVFAEENAQLKAENQELRSTMSDLSDRMNNMEQHVRENNLEIHGIPENRAENVRNVIQQCAKVVKYDLKSEDVILCTRVAKQNRVSKLPRTIIVKFKSMGCRDGFYSAVHRYNKSHPKEKLNTSLLGYAGEKIPVYVSEHLSPQNKTLHAAARMKAKAASFKFVWVRNGRIFARKDPTSQYIHVKNTSSLDLIK